MNIKRENLAKSRVKLTIEVPAEKTVGYFEEAFKKLAPSVEIKGFRPGQAPKIMILESIGQGRYHQTALDIALPQTYYDAIQSEKLIPVQPPTIAVKEFSEGKSLIYDAEVDIVPEVKLGNYKKVKIKYKKPEIKTSKEEIDEVLRKLRFQAAAFTNVDRPAQKGDRVEINFEGKIDNVPQENLTSKNHPIILGEGTLIPGFEKELEGMKKDEEKEFDLEVPHVEDKNKKKKAHFTVKVIDVKEVIMPEVDDEFAKKFGHNKVEKLKEAIEKSIVDEKNIHERQHLEKEVLEKVVSLCKVEIPESLIDQEITRRLGDIQQQMGPGFPNYIEKMGKTLADIRKDMMPSAESSVKTGLILGEIAKAEGLLKHTHDQKEQQEVIKKTIDRLIENAIK